MATSGSKTVTVTSWDSLVFSWSVSGQSVANNTSTVTWALKLVATGSGRIDSSASKDWSVTVNGTNYSGTNTVGISNNSTKTLASGTTVIKHADDGTKTFSYSFSQEFAITFSGTAIGTISGSGSGTLNTIPRASSLTASNGTLNTAQTLTINRADSSFKHRITYTCGSASGYAAASSSTYTTATSISWTPPLSLASQNKTGTSVSVKFTLHTYTSDGTKIGTATKTISCSIPTSVKPSVSLTVTDPTGYVDTYGAYIKGLSKFAVTVTPTLAYGSGIKSYSTNANGSKYTSASFTTGVLKSSGTLSVSTTVTDNRGRSGSASESLAVLNYTAPNISRLTVKRCNADGTENNQGEYVQVTFSGTVTSLNSKNSATYTIGYKQTSAEEYTSVTLTDLQDQYSVTDSTYIFAADTDSSYNVKLSIADDFSTATTTTSASTAFTLIHWLANGLGMAIGKLAELTNVLDIGFQTRFSGGILHPILEPETDLDDVRTPNTYIGGDLNTYQYANCPIEGGTFTLEVVGAGELGQVKQRIQTCSKELSKAFERYYHTGSWGSWVCVSDYAGTLLWENSWYMKASQTANLSEGVSKQKNGIVLVFVEYTDGAVANSAFHSFFIPKKVVELHPGKGHTFVLATGKFGVMATKYLYISDTSITGNDDNSLTGTGTSGVVYTNNKFVLRYVLGV